MMNLSLLRPLYERPGPWASAYLTASRNVEHADVELDLRWRALRESLTSQGADASTVAALDDAVLGHQPLPSNYGLALFGSHGEVALTVPLSAPPRSELAAWGPLPHAMPMIVQRGEEIAWLRVIADRTGADLEGATAGGIPRREQVNGPDTFPIRKVKPGGWSQLHHQHAAEETWQRNADEVAAAAAALADEIGAEVLVVGGDVRAVQLLVERLPARWRDRVVRTDAGSRATGADNEPLDDVTIRAVAEVADRHTRDALERFMIQYGNDAAAGTGMAAVVAGLQREQVDTVLIVDDPSATGELWIGPEPNQLAETAEDLHAMGVSTPQRTRADAALLRAMAMTGARLVLVGPGEAPLDGGVGAVLRYADAGTLHR
jgi:hypothetical protein